MQSSTGTIYLSSLLYNLIVLLCSLVLHWLRNAVAAGEMLTIIVVKIASAGAVFVGHLPLAPTALRY